MTKASKPTQPSLLVNIGDDEIQGQADHQYRQAAGQRVALGGRAQDALAAVEQVQDGQHEHIEGVRPEQVAGGQVGLAQADRGDRGEQLGQRGGAGQQQDADEHAAQAGARGDDVAGFGQVVGGDHDQGGGENEFEPDHAQALPFGIMTAQALDQGDRPDGEDAGVGLVQVADHRFDRPQGFIGRLAVFDHHHNGDVVTFIHLRAGVEVAHRDDLLLMAVQAGGFDDGGTLDAVIGQGGQNMLETIGVV